MNPTRIPLIVAGLGGIVALVAAAFGESGVPVALGALAVSVLAGTVWAALSGRSTDRTLARVERLLRAQKRRSSAARSDQRETLRQVRSSATANERSVKIGLRTERLSRQQLNLAKKQHERGGQTLRDARELRTTVQRTPGLTVELQRQYDRLVPHAHPMPELGGFALTPSTLLWILDHLATTGTQRVLECGSGTSTIWIATALEHRGGPGEVIALESSEEYAQQTRDHLERLGLSHRARVVHAPLVDTTLEGRDTAPWFDLTDLGETGPVDLLFVDGPVGTTAPQIRYPAFPLLADRLASGATVLLDDTPRPHEARIAELWSEETHHGRRLERVSVLDRSTVFAAHEA